MLFFLRKLIEALLLPLGFCGLLVLVAVVLRRRWIAVVAVFTLYALSTDWVGLTLIAPLEHVYPPIKVADAPHVDAIVVLSGGITRGRNAAGMQWDNSANRFFAGVDLALARKSRVLVISSGYFLSTGELLRQAAVRDGVAPETIILTPRVLTTEDEAGQVSRISGIHSVLLVTSAYHMPRAARLFRSRGLEVIPFPTDQRAPLHGIGALAIQLVPGPGGIALSEAALREYYGLVVYRAILLFRSH